jgi:hypothetical protein
MPNLFANLVFFGWPIVVYYLLRKHQVNNAIFLSIVLSVLLLPAGFEIDAPLIPPLGRESLTALSLLVSFYLLKIKFRFFQPGFIVKVLIFYLIIKVTTVLLNGSMLYIGGGKYLPGMTLYDAFSEVIRTLLWISPFFIGRYFFKDVKGNENILKLLVILGLLYSIPMLYEIRMSPQLHAKVYGFYPGDFIQSMRGDGFRASVFVGHGLPLAFWLSTCMVSAMALHKNKILFGKYSALFAIIFLGIVLILSQTWSALLNTIMGVLLIYKFSPSNQVKISFLLASLIMLYPVTKIMGIYPDKEIVHTIAEYNTERADSMKTRYVNEDQLLTHAMDKPFFGWGGYGRNRVFDAMGKDISITDGNWIIHFGVNGAFGFVFYYLLLLCPLYYATRSIRYIENLKDRRYFALLAIILSICIIDSVPNTNMWAVHFLLAGALLGQAELLRKQRFLLLNKRDS